MAVHSLISDFIGNTVVPGFNAQSTGNAGPGPNTMLIPQVDRYVRPDPESYPACAIIPRSGQFEIPRAGLSCTATGELYIDIVVYNPRNSKSDDFRNIEIVMQKLADELICYLMQKSVQSQFCEFGVHSTGPISWNWAHEERSGDGIRSIYITLPCRFSIPTV